MTHRWIITALGKDRPGIVAGVTKALYQLGCNLEDSAMTRLEGEFAVMLIFSAPAKQTDEQLRRAFESLGRKLKLTIHLQPLSAGEASSPAKRGRAYLISVYGADQPGIVYRISEALAGLKVNITDVQTHRSAAEGRRKPSLYVMILEVELPAGLTEAVLEPRLKALGKAMGVEVSLRSVEADVL